jgi:hypothetical protein
MEPTIKNVVNSVGTTIDTQLSSIKVQVGHLNKGWRALILANRAANRVKSMPALSETLPAVSKARNLHYANMSSLSVAEMVDFIDTQDGLPWTLKRRIDSYVHTLDAKRRQVKSIPEARQQQHNEDKSNFTPVKESSSKWKSKETYRNSQTISIVNMQVSPYISLELQNRPNEISITPGANWVSVKSMGRNEPFLMYTGGESSIQLELSWYANDKDNYEEVVNKCRLLESWTKADGYTKAPPVLMLVWGTSNLFEDQSFVLTSATYKLSNFQAYAKDSEGNVIDRGLLPACATQTLIFKRATTNNTTYEGYIPTEKLKKTKGIHLEEA